MNQQTKFEEERFTTSDPKRMLQMFLAKDLRRGWKENFVDKDTAEVVTIERSELIANKGQLIEGDLLSRIMFHMQAGEVTEVEVSNQRREGHLQLNTHAFPWEVVAGIGDKSIKFLLYAADAKMANDIIIDYVEQNFNERFYIKSIKGFKTCIMITDKLIPISSEAPFEQISDDILDDTAQEFDPENAGMEESDQMAHLNPFYFIELTQEYNDINYQLDFVVQAKDADNAMSIIRAYLTQKQIEHATKEKEEIKSFKLSLIAAKQVKCNYVIDKEFTEKYIEALEQKLEEERA